MPSFVRGHKCIDEVLHRGTGRLLTKAMASANFKKDYLHTATRHLTLARPYEEATVDADGGETVRHFGGIDGASYRVALWSVMAQAKASTIARLGAWVF